jgi:hypothetical protein
MPPSPLSPSPRPCSVVLAACRRLVSVAWQWWWRSAVSGFAWWVLSSSRWFRPRSGASPRRRSVLVSSSVVVEAFPSVLLGVRRRRDLPPRRLGSLASVGPPLRRLGCSVVSVPVGGSSSVVEGRRRWWGVVVGGGASPSPVVALRHRWGVVVGGGGSSSWVGPPPRQWWPSVVARGSSSRVGVVRRWWGLSVAGGG